MILSTDILSLVTDNTNNYTKQFDHSLSANSDLDFIDVSSKYSVMVYKVFHWFNQQIAFRRNFDSDMMLFTESLLSATRDYIVRQIFLTMRGLKFLLILLLRDYPLRYLWFFWIVQAVKNIFSICFLLSFYSQNQIVKLVKVYMLLMLNPVNNPILRL